MPLDAAGAPELVIGRMLDKARAGGEFVYARGFSGRGERAGVQKEIVGVLIEFAEGVFLGAFHALRVVVTVGLAEGAVVEEVVAHPDVDHGGLRRDGFYRGMRIDAGGLCEETGIGDAEDADAAGVVGNIFDEPGDGVVGVGAFVDQLGIFVVDHGAGHDESAFGFIAAANIFEDEDVAVFDEFGVAGVDAVGVGFVDPVGSTFHQDRQRSGGIFGREDYGVEFYAVANGDHHFFTGELRLVGVLRRIADFGDVAHGVVRAETVEADSIAFRRKQKLDGDRLRIVFGGESVDGLGDVGLFGGAGGFDVEAGAFEGGGGIGAGIVVIVVGADVGGGLFYGNVGGGAGGC